MWNNKSNRATPLVETLKKFPLSLRIKTKVIITDYDIIDYDTVRDLISIYLSDMSSWYFYLYILHSATVAPPFLPHTRYAHACFLAIPLPGTLFYTSMTISVIFKLPQCDYPSYFVKMEQIVYCPTALLFHLFSIEMINFYHNTKFSYLLYLFPVFPYYTNSLTWASVICLVWSRMYPSGLGHCWAHNKFSINIFRINLANQGHSAPQRSENLTDSLKFCSVLFNVKDLQINFSMQRSQKLGQQFLSQLFLSKWTHWPMLSSPYIFGTLIICFLVTFSDWEHILTPTPCLSTSFHSTTQIHSILDFSGCLWL